MQYVGGVYWTALCKKTCVNCNVRRKVVHIGYCFVILLPLRRLPALKKAGMHILNRSAVIVKAQSIQEVQISLYGIDIGQ